MHKEKKICILFRQKTRFYIKCVIFVSIYGVTVSFSCPVSKRESGVKPELYP